MLNRPVTILSHQITVMGIPHQWDNRERNTDRQHDLGDNQRICRIRRKPQHHQRRNQRHHAASPHRRMDVQQAAHNLRTRIRAHRSRRQRRGEQTNRENRPHHRAERHLDRMLGAFDGVRALHAVQRIGRQHKQRKIHRARQRERPHHINLGAAQQLPGIRLLLTGSVMIIHQRGMQINRVRHHRRTQNRRRHQHRIRSTEPRDQTSEHIAAVRRVDEQAGDEAEGDHQQHRNDNLLKHTMRATALEPQQNR